MSDLSISYFEIPRKAISIQASSQGADFPVENLFIGSAKTYWRTAELTTESFITFDLGSSVTKSVDHLIISGVKAMLAQADSEVDINLRASTDNFVASDVSILLDSNLTDTDLVGIDSDSLIITDTESSAYRYWRLKITSDTAIYHTLRAASFGTLFSFGSKSPKVGYTAGIQEPVFNNMNYSSSRGRRGRVYSMNYNGVTDANRITFEDEMYEYTEDYLTYLVEAASPNTQILSGKRVVLGRITQAGVRSEYNDVNAISLSFEEEVYS